MTTQSWLWLAVCKWCKNQEIDVFTFNRTYLHSTHYFTSSNCIFMQLQGIVFIQLQENEILVNCQGNKFIQRTRNIIHKKYISFEAIIFFHEIIFISRSLSVYSRKYILVQGKHIHSGKLYPFKEIHLFRESSRPYVHSRKLYSLNIVAFADIAEIFIQKLSPATLW